MKKLQKKDIAIAVLVVLVVFLASTTIFFYLSNLDLETAVTKLIETIIQDSNCKTLHAFESNPDDMKTFGDIIIKTMQEKSCP